MLLPPSKNLPVCTTFPPHLSTPRNSLVRRRERGVRKRRRSAKRKRKKNRNGRRKRKRRRKSGWQRKRKRSQQWRKNGRKPSRCLLPRKPSWRWTEHHEGWAASRNRKMTRSVSCCVIFFFGHILFFVVDYSWFIVLRSSMSRYCPGLVVHGPMENCAVYTCIIYSVTCTVYFRHALNITICCSCLWFIIVIVTYKISDFEKK